jgi:lipopolysaccharide exporter
MAIVESQGESIGRRSITAMLWGAGGSALRIGLQVLAQIILARILGPELYGVFAVALVIVLLSSLFADVGLAYGLIQKATVSDDDIRFVFTWQVAMGLAATVVVLVAAPWLAQLYDDPGLVPVIQLLAASCFINASAATSGALLRRELDFKSLNVAAVVSYGIGFFLVGIPLAWIGAGVMSLVAAYLVQAAIMAVMLYWRVRHSVTPLFWQPGAPAMLSFGGTVLATNLLNWVMNGIDRAIVGTWLGLQAAGLYATAYNLISAPLMTVLALLQSVFYSASSKVQDDPERMRRGLSALFGAVTLFLAPVFAGVAVAADAIVHTLYGPKWAGAGSVLAPLALAMPVYLLMGLAIPVLWASGATRKEFQLQLPIAAIWIGALWLVARTGSLTLLSWAVLGLFAIRALVLVGATLRAVNMPAGDAWRVMLPGIGVTMVVGMATLLADRMARGWSSDEAILLLIDIAVSAVAMAAGLRIFGRWIDDAVLDLLRQTAGRLPGKWGMELLRLLLGIRPADAAGQ